MGIYLPHLRDLVIIPTLKSLDMYSPAAVNLLMGTAMQESNCEYLKQLGGGPALGIYQMEPATHEDLWDNYITLHRNIWDRIPDEPYYKIDTEMIWNIKYATLMARIHYWRVAEALPDKDDVEGLANYWKKYWNTLSGKGKPSQFYLHYNTKVKEHAL